MFTRVDWCGEEMWINWKCEVLRSCWAPTVIILFIFLCPDEFENATAFNIKCTFLHHINHMPIQAMQCNIHSMARHLHRNHNSSTINLGMVFLLIDFYVSVIINKYCLLVPAGELFFYCKLLEFCGSCTSVKLRIFLQQGKHKYWTLQHFFCISNTCR